jgi:HlyD family secretion protein
MKTYYWIAAVVLVAALTDCSGGITGAAATPIPTISLGSAPAQSSSGGGVNASGKVVPVHYVQLSFPMTGIVKTVEVAEGDQVTAGQQLVTLDTTLLEAQVKEAQANLDAADTQVRYLTRIGTDQEHLDSAHADVDRAQAQLDSAKATLAEATLSASSNGTIAEVDISPAETVVPGQIVITMGDLSQFQIETTDLSERDVPNVQTGQTATVSIQALNQQFSGKVSDVALISSTIGGDVVYKVTIDLDQQPQGLRWGLTADITIQTGK